MKNNTQNILELVSKLLRSSEYAVSDIDQKNSQKVDYSGKDITFYTSSKKIIYINCDYTSDKKLDLFLYDLLDIYFKTQDVKQNNCLSPVTTHEIKNILSSAKLSLEMLSTYDFDLEDRKKLAHQAFDSVNQSINVFEEMLQVERLAHEHAKKEIQIEDVNIISLLNKIIVLVALDLKHKNIKLNFDNTQNEITIQGSPFWLERAFYNLLSNAIKYNVENGTIDITVTKAQNNIKVIISDTGIGISDNDKKNIFDKFFISKNSEGIGTGVGLTLIKSVIDAHEGTIKFDSKIGSGTQFGIILPIKPKKYIENPMSLFGTAASVLLIVGLSYLFPIIPKFDDVEKSGLFETVMLEDGSKIQMSKDGDHSFWHFRNLTNSKNYMRLNVTAGLIDADLKGSKVTFYTPNSKFENLGTTLMINQSNANTATSVYNGAIQSAKQKTSQGHGFAVSDDGLQKDAKLLLAPNELKYYNAQNGELTINFDIIKNAKEYLVIIAKDEKFIETIAINKTKSNIFATKIDEDGYYFVKISAIDKNNIIGYPLSGVIKNVYHLKQGIKYRDKGDTAKAINLFNLSNKEFQMKDYEPYGEIGWSYYIKGEHAKSIIFFNKALSINPSNKNKIRLARSLYHLKEYEKAKKLYLSMLGEDANTPDALWGLSEVYIAQNRVNDAKQLLGKLIAIDSKYPLANYDMARVSMLEGNRELVKSYLDKELSFNPSNTIVVKEMLDKFNKGE